jgi:hypothetical protein
MKYADDAYTYLLKHIPTNQFYYGVRWGNKVPPEEDLWIHYFSSSERVKDLINEYGIDSFEYEIRKKFECEKAAIAWETKVLLKMKVLENKEIWLNRNAGNAILLDEKAKEKIKAYNNKPEVKALKSSRVKGDKNPSCRPEVQAKIKAGIAETRKRQKEEGTGYYSEEYRQNMSRATSGSGNGRSKKYILTSPTGDQYTAYGTLKHFCSEHGLSYEWAAKNAKNNIREPGIEGWSIYEAASPQAGKNRTHINNGTKQKMCFIEELPYMLDQGWQRGTLPYDRKQLDIEAAKIAKEKCRLTKDKRKEAGWVHPSKGKKRDPAVVEKSASKLRGRKFSDAHRLKLIEANKNRVVTEETRKKLSKASSGSNNGMYGKSHSEETKAKIRATKAANKLAKLSNQDPNIQ